jgi:MarR family transcriptional regulator, organic hydroperoxide resistance regulator
VKKTKTYGGFLISQVHQLSGRTFEKLLKDSGVDAFNGAQGRILYVLWEHDNLSITEIGRLTSLAKTTLTSMLDRMEKSGLIRRLHDQNNRRQILISITEKARGFHEIYDQISEQMNALFYQGFTETEIVNFEDTLKKIINNLEIGQEIVTHE